jgi:hypothetical protein
MFTWFNLPAVRQNREMPGGPLANENLARILMHDTAIQQQVLVALVVTMVFQPQNF